MKPSNIVLDENGEPRIVDFGIARDLLRETRTWLPRGTPYYMSPEQARLGGMTIDHRTDIYSLGVVGYELLTRHVPFDGDTDEDVFTAIRGREPERITRRNRTVPRDLETILLKAMRKDRRRRYATAEEFAEDLERVVRHESPLAKPPGLVEKLGPWVYRRRVPVAAAASAIVAFFATFGSLRWRTARADDGDIDQVILRLQSIDAVTDGPVAAIRELEECSRAVSAMTLRTSLDDEKHRRLQGVRVDVARAAEVVLDRAVRAIPGSMRTTPMLRGDDEVARLVYTAVRAARLGAVVRAIRVDPVTFQPLEDAEPEELGTTPLLEHPIRIGYYRVFLEGPHGRSGELIRAFDMATAYELPTVHLRTESVVVDGMVRIEPGRFAAGANTESSATTIDLDGFYVDRFEVTNREYRRFLDATGRPPPRAWPAGHRDVWQAASDDMPVCCVTFFDVEAYAAWAGKRLLHATEWQRAARGVEGRLTPWDDPRTADDLRALANLHDPERAQYRPDPTLSRDATNALD